MRLLSIQTKSDDGGEETSKQKAKKKRRRGNHGLRRVCRAEDADLSVRATAESEMHRPDYKILTARRAFVCVYEDSRSVTPNLSVQLSSLSSLCTTSSSSRGCCVNERVPEAQGRLCTG